ncbi:VanZ family protein [Candidatus Cetobacterium colombiensis]|uniref:VanZ family protein n=1 Tax=Candidatus Cetobacterium colombiensis TaxID=3073100 RepID=A0ABU4W5W6_9FUSO|nr:VanZ family protein [Candidatus Cetobacterium colombiensis]MDX8334918.1 VanZ family protein [Candidatus Cetobacterium colombiensis]
MKKEKVFKILSIAIMLSIFWFSHQDRTESAKQSDYVEKQMDKIIGRGIKFNIRKNAHFFIYMLLGISLLMSREEKGKKEIFQVVGFLILYALSDEYHQRFVPGRGASLTDVGIDTLGGICGILMVKTALYTKNIDFYRKSTE